MKTLKTKVSEKFMGPAPVDFIFVAEKKILNNDGKIVYLQAESIPFGGLHYYATEISFFDKEIENLEINSPLESYDNLETATKSIYYKYFKKLDNLLEKRIREVYSYVDDTKYCGGIRFGAKADKNGISYYCEGVAHLIKTDEYIYLQVVMNKDSISYSVTKTSIFLRLELCDLYETYFDNLVEVKKVVDTNDLNKLNEYDYLKDDFEDIIHRLNDYKQNIG